MPDTVLGYRDTAVSPWSHGEQEETESMKKTTQYDKCENRLNDQQGGKAILDRGGAGGQVRPFLLKWHLTRKLNEAREWVMCISGITYAPNFI